MQRVRPVRMSATETAAVWVRWRRGGSISEIGRAMDRSPGSIFYQLATHGGISPVPRTRSWRALTLHDREEISRGLASGRSLRAISVGLGRAPSTISREVQRHGGRAQYRAAAADVCTWYRARRPKPCRLATSAALRALVAAKLAADWSPQQIAGWLKQTFPDHPHLQVSHETIYVSLFVQSRGVLKKELFTHLRRRRRMRQARQATTAGQARGRIIDAVSIRERPAEAADRAVPGHWEGDLLSGARNSHIATLVERRSRVVLLVRLPGKDTVRVVRALSRAVRALPAGLMASLTWDRGGELAAHRTFTVATDVHVYFCDPQSPWQRGTNENTNGLLRQYFPRGTDLSTYTQAERVMDVLPKRLGRYGLTLHADKTRVLPFGRPPRRQQGGKGPASFDFLGFTLYWRRARSGRWGMWCKTRSSRLQRAITVAATWCRRHRHRPVAVQHAALTRRIQGHFNYFGVSGNARSLGLLVDATERHWYKWLRRRSNRTRLTWPRFVALLDRYPLPVPRIRVRIWGASP